MNTITKTILAVVTAFSVATFAAEKVYMAPVGTTNIHSDYGIAAQKLMKTYIEDDGRFILVEGTAADSVVLEKQETVKAKAIEKGCDKYLIAEFTRLGDNVILSFKFYSTGSETPIWQDRLKAANPDDFDPIIQRVARTIGTNEKATNDEDIYNITENEARLPKRKKVNSYFGIGIGGMVLKIGQVTLTEVAVALILGIIVNLILRGKGKEKAGMIDPEDEDPKKRSQKTE